MKYSLNINQIAAHHLDIIGKVDLVDLCLFDAFKSFANSKRCEKRIDEGGIWFWVSYAEIIKEVPLAGIKSKDAVYRRMVKLKEAGIIVFHPDNQKLAKAFFQWGENYDAMERKDWPETPTDKTPKVKNLRMKHRTPTDETPNPYGSNTEPPTDETPNNQYTNNQDTDQSTNQRNEVGEFDETLEAEKKEKGASLAARPAPAESAAPDHTHMVSDFLPETPGVRTVTGISLKADKIMEAEKAILDWAESEGLETVKYRFSTARRHFSQEDLPLIIAHYVSVYGSLSDSSKSAMLRNPIEHFSTGLFKYLINQNGFERSSKPGASAQTSNRANLNSLGSNQAAYLEEPLF
jgi:hypothetical protein